MKPTETASNAVLESVTQKASKSLQLTKQRYQKVRDGRKQPIRGLWVRNGRFYARLTVEDAAGIKKVRWIPLEGKKTMAEAVAALRKLQTQREENELPGLKQTPKLKDYKTTYFNYFETVKDAKRPATIQKEKGTMKLWVEHIGETRLNKISRAQLNDFIAKRQGAGISGRTVNLDIIALRNVLKKAMENNLLKSLPMQGMKPVKYIKVKKALAYLTEIEAICNAALQCSKNGQQFSDYIKLMAFCGSRRSETLRLKWSAVHWHTKQITVGADGLSKNGKNREVEFNGKLKTHLKDMFKRRAPDSQWIFPSPQRGTKDVPTKTFKQSLELARKHLLEKENKVSEFTFHDCRHFFISYCVMSGIQNTTIAEWVSHKDGGVLIGKVYGHLAKGYKQQEATKLNFEPAILEHEALAG
jgi:integrase